MNTKIKDIPIYDRPRERIKLLGPESLSDEELFAIIIKTGTREASAKLLASKLLAKVGGIQKVTKLNYKELTKIKGIGDAKACTLLAIIEISKRINKEVVSLQNIKITNSKLVYKYYKDILSDKKQEYFYCLYLDSKKKVIADKLLFIGTLNKSIVHPREIFKEAYQLSASSIICIHNHPSGDIKPSIEDIEITKQLVEIGKMQGIPIIDHIIVGHDKYYSFYENNLLN